MSGRDLIPPMRTPMLPASVLADHFVACAQSLPGASVDGLADLAGVLSSLVDGQRALASALGELAKRFDGSGCLDLDALHEVLDAAGCATGHAADALAETGPLLDAILHADPQS